MAVGLNFSWSFVNVSFHHFFPPSILRSSINNNRPIKHDHYAINKGPFRGINYSRAKGVLAREKKRWSCELALLLAVCEYRLRKRWSPIKRCTSQPGRPHAAERETRTQRARGVIVSAPRIEKGHRLCSFISYFILSCSSCPIPFLYRRLNVGPPSSRVNL